MASLLTNIHSPPYTGIHTTHRISPTYFHPNILKGSMWCWDAFGRARVEGHGHCRLSLRWCGVKGPVRPCCPAPLSCPEAGFRNALEPQVGHTGTAHTAEETFLPWSNSGHNTGGARKRGYSAAPSAPQFPSSTGGDVKAQEPGACSQQEPLPNPLSTPDEVCPIRYLPPTQVLPLPSTGNQETSKIRRERLPSPPKVQELLKKCRKQD